MFEKLLSKFHTPQHLLFALFSFLWTTVFAFSLWYNLTGLDERAQEAARIQARTVFEKDVAYVLWNTRHGGVMVPLIADRVTPSPYLSPAGREITTKDNTIYTKIDPGAMLRNILDSCPMRTGVEGRLTGRTPVNKNNTPDTWENKALQLLESGEAEEVSSVEILHDSPYMRFMRPLKAESGCIACHAGQGYSVGHPAGGISVSVPMTQLYNQFASMRVACLVTHIGLWLLGMTGMYYCLSSIAAGARMRVRVEENLREEVRHRLSLEKTLREAATTDSLTKLLNRGAMLERLSLEVARYMRNDVVFALLMADIDFFKQLNDSRGHEAGDRVLVEIANRIRSALRAQDAVARWGGEEFLVLLPETELTSAYMVGEKIRKCVDGIPINLGGDIFTVTISIGVTEFRPELDIAFSIKCADNALYAAKKKGRNRVEMSVP